MLDFIKLHYCIQIESTIDLNFQVAKAVHEMSHHSLDQAIKAFSITLAGWMKLAIPESQEITTQEL